MDLAEFKSKLADYQEKYEDDDGEKLSKERGEECYSLEEIFDGEDSESLTKVLGVEAKIVDCGRDYDNAEPDVQFVVVNIEDKYFRVDGSYDSWNGSSYDDLTDGWYEVQAKEKTITVWETKE